MVLPVTTLPKAALPGVMLRPACTPVPVMEALALPPWLLAMLRLPVTEPVAVGEKVMLIGTLCEGAMEAPAESPLTETPLTEAET